jgi:probable rRNA maturation factor
LTKIKFSSENVDYQLNNVQAIKEWIIFIAKNEKVIIEEISYILVSEIEILEINKKFLNHNYSTDIITFDYSFMNRIKGEILIGMPVVIHNSIIYSNGSIELELFRNIVHGLLHLIGYNDETKLEAKMMRTKEDLYLFELKKFVYY